MAEDYFLRIDYSFSSFMDNCLMGEEPTDFVNEFELKIYHEDEIGGMPKLVGKGRLNLLHLNRAIDMDYPLMDVFDASASIWEMAEVVFNLEEEDNYWSKLDDFYEYDMLSSYDTCFIEEIELLPELRGKGLGKWIIKNIIEQFYGSCGLVVVRAAPLQHGSESYVPDDWHKKMKYEAFAADLEQGQYKLFHFFQQLGFSKPFEQEYFILRPEEFDFDQFWEDEE